MSTLYSRRGQHRGDAPILRMKQASGLSLPKELSGNLTEVALGCQRMLEENPCHPEALVGITLVALASGQARWNHQKC